MRTSIICELASNHGGNWDVCADLIRSAADHGADWVKLQLYDATLLAETDPQKEWLTQCQVTRPVLDRMIGVADKADIRLTASVFGIPESQMAKAAGLTTIKIGSGDSMREDLSDWCAANFSELWLSYGLGWPYDTVGTSGAHYVSFHGVTQYPTPYFRGLTRLKAVTTWGPWGWGWSDHGENTEVAKEAILRGATYVEVHYTLGVGRGCRHDLWDRDKTQLADLRKFAESCAWGPGVPEYDAAVKKYIGRWEAK
jgi:sialic acid synthase SpsE